MLMDLYKFNEFDPIGAGAHATVFDAMHIPTGKRVALKRIQLKDNAEITLAMLRECHILMEMQHPNILRLERVLVHGGFLYLVLEKMVSSMREHFRSSSNEYEDPQMIKKYLKQFLSGVSYCHCHEVLHRDLKPENVLISGEDIKISDFGSARTFLGVEPTKLTPAIVTVDYRAPELLLGSGDYSKEVDMWAVGCIFGEMWNMKPLFGPESDVDLGLDYVKSLFGRDSDVEIGLDYATVALGKFFRALGTPNEDTWPGVSKLKPPHNFYFHEEEPQGLGTLVPRLIDEAAGRDLLSKLLCLNPEERISAEAALKHAYFADPERLAI